MGRGLEGKRIGIGGSRKIEEISTLIEKQGGIPVIRPLQGTIFLAEKELKPELEMLMQEGADWVVFTTGIGIEALLDLAEKLDIKDEFIRIIGQAKIASRGYKTRSSLKKLGVTPLAVDDDGTTNGLIRALEDVDFTGEKAVIQLHGENAPALTKFLKDKGASVSTILPYRHIPPSEETVERLLNELENHEIDAFCFTTAVQVRSLFQYAKQHGKLTELINAFNQQVLAVAVGKVTAEALSEEGVERFIVPENERMGAMIIEVSHYYENVLMN